MPGAQNTRRPSAYGQSRRDTVRWSVASGMPRRSVTLAAAPRHQSSSSESQVPQIIHPADVEFQTRLRFFFKNPVQKLCQHGVIPWKLVLQAVKIVVVTIHLMSFGNQISQHYQHESNTLETFKKIFVPETDLSQDIIPYPPAFPVSLHTKDEFYAHVNKAISVYAVIGEVSLGLIGYGDRISEQNPISPIEFCIESYAHATVNPSFRYFNFSRSIVRSCSCISNELWTPEDPVKTIRTRPSS